MLPIAFNGGGENCRGIENAALLITRVCPQFGLGGLPTGSTIGQIGFLSLPDPIDSSMHMWIGARIIGCRDSAIDPALNAWRRQSSDAQRDAFIRITMRSAARRLQIWWLRCLVRMIVRPWLSVSVATQTMIEEQ